MNRYASRRSNLAKLYFILFFPFFAWTESMGQVQFPAVDEFKGMYNGRSIFGHDQSNGETKLTTEVLFNSEKARISPTMEEVKSVGECVRDFEKEIVGRLRDAGSSLQGYEEATYLVPGDRTIHFLPGHYLLVTKENCEKLAELLRRRFSLWRVLIVAPGTEEVPIVYPGRVVIPKSWQGREESYWKFLLDVGKNVHENTHARLDELKMKLVISQLKMMHALEKTDSGIQFEILAIFEENRIINQLPSVILDIWVRTDNKYPGVCYLSNHRASGLWGIESKFGINKKGQMSPHRFGVFAEDDEEFRERLYVLSFKAECYKGAIYLKSPETGQDFSVTVPADVPKWSQVGESILFERSGR